MPKKTEKGYEYIKNYTKEHYHYMSIGFKNDSERDDKIYSFLNTVPSKSEFVKQLVLEYMEKSGN